MALTQAQQIHQILEGKKHILITFRNNGNGDAIASAIAMFLFLKKIGKRVDIVSENFELPKTMNFLKASEKIKSGFSHLQKFILTADINKTGLQELSYDVKKDKLKIYLTPKNGFLTRDNITTAQSDFKYDLIITVDTQDLDSLGTLFYNNTELFYSVPILNIDDSSANEHFGKINIVNLSSTSTAEIVYDLLKKMGEEYIDEDIATALLSGMIAKTRSFKTENVKPSTLAIAGKLISLGAKRDYIIQNLYRTKSIPTLKLWGKALEHLNTEKSFGLVWTTITRDDFSRSGAGKHELYDIIDELISNSPEAKITLLLHEDPEQGSKKIHGIIKTNRLYNAKELVKNFQPEGNSGTAKFTVKDSGLAEIEEKIISNIKEKIKNPQ
ncbi:MAG: hypothetical protein GF349_00500 [Candidatus Magasanikbacteria bacterium]|nr:hypothetical protein [Candidatus Magasanikbacteria bacterium]